MCKLELKLLDGAQLGTDAALAARRARALSRIMCEPPLRVAGPISAQSLLQEEKEDVAVQVGMSLNPLFLCPKHGSVTCPLTSLQAGPLSRPSEVVESLCTI